MQIGLHVCEFTTSDGSPGIAPLMERVVAGAEDAGIHSLWPMDHFFQIPVFGPPEQPMLEAYATLAWAAGRTERLELGTLVTGVHYRHPGVLLKAVTTLDVLSRGRAWLGIGAGWNEEESRGLGIPFPTLKERFEHLEDTLRIAHRMFAGDEQPYDGTHHHLERPLNNPAPVRRPPIMLGGGGERKTLRMVAQYADACNLFETRDPAGLEHKLSVLRRHCEDVGRPYEEITRTTFGMIGPYDVGPAVERFGRLSERGVDLALVDLPDPSDDKVYAFLAEVVRQVAPLGRPLPVPRAPAAVG